jgi:hypothetical protein
MWWPEQMVAERRQQERAEIMRVLNDAYAKMESQRRIEEELAWAQHDAQQGAVSGLTDRRGNDADKRDARRAGSLFRAKAGAVEATDAKW